MTEDEHDNGNLQEAQATNLRPDARRERTDILFREMARAEALERHEKTERLKRARMEATRDGL
jgi:hypothetical protein